MKYDELFKDKYRIKAARLECWDYSSNGYYFVTICTQDRTHYFGEVVNGQMILNELGMVAQECWNQIVDHFPFVILDVFIIMPNHVHGILLFYPCDVPVETQNIASPVHLVNENMRETETQNIASLQKRKTTWTPNDFGPQSMNLASVIRGYKIGVTKWAKSNNVDFMWQPRYYEHIVRDEESLNNIRRYIINNPVNWNNDRNK